MNDAPATARAGLLAGSGAYLIWGLLPLYLKLLTGIPAGEVLAHRIVWSLPVMAVVTTLAGGWRRLREALATPRLVLLLLASSLCIAVNWLVYTWAILGGHVLDTSLGYFINPLVSVVFGVVLLGERLGRAQQVAVALAALGVVIETVSHGELPLISLALALSFGTYGLIRKRAAVDAATGLFVETLVLAPFAVAWLLWLPGGPLGQPPALLALLAAGGVLTALPLLLFGLAARRLPLSTLGLLQYLAPSMVFLQAVFLFGEALDPWRLLAFACIWAGLAVYTLALLRRPAAGPTRGR
ncbi:protein rarD [alpha proteobacterium AAP81b]|nr:protein rarD [alpha proteobacterium AAP81b]